MNATPTINLADLEQDKHVTRARTLIGNWPPTFNLGAFFGQSEDADELDRIVQFEARAREDALRLLETWEGHREDAARVRALIEALGGSGHLLENYSNMLLTLGIGYGLRLASTQGAR